MKLKKELDVSKVALEYQTETSIRMFMKLPQVSLQLSTILLAPPMQPSITPQGPKSGKTKAPKVIKEDFSKGFKLE